MFSLLYIGQYTLGDTSRMRAEVISKIIGEDRFNFININIPFYRTHRVFRSLGFRYKIGPSIWAINNYIKSNLNNANYDIIWIDKGVFIKPSTIKLLKQKSKKLVHYTPDMAFYANNSKDFKFSLPFYDYAITTKSVEIDRYLKYVKKEKLIYTTQGFDKKTHRPYHEFYEKENAVIFIGLGEPSRYEIVTLLINNCINVKLVGKGWKKFVNTNKENKYLKFISDGVFGDDYSKLISSSKFALGLLSKNFPELHTTRTFEVPACGTALITERNVETTTYFNEDEVIFYDTVYELIEKIRYYNSHPIELEKLTKRGFERVYQDDRDYDAMLRNILLKIAK